jgi:hypothetical protein
VKGLSQIYERTVCSFHVHELWIWKNCTVAVAVTVPMSNRDLDVKYDI